MPNELIGLDSAEQIKLWNDVLGHCGHHDIYHTSQYHQAAQDQGQGKATLLVVEHAAEIIALPLLVRRLDDIEGIPAGQYRDATSVYGYGGPVTSLQEVPEQSAEWSEIVGQAMLQLMNKLELVSVFTRLHPLVDTAWVFDAIGQTFPVGPTVVIDLDQTEQAHNKDMRQNYRRVVKKMTKLGVEVYEDSDWTHLDKFLAAYTETMTRVAAKQYYFFDKEYFENLHDRLGERVKLFHAVLDGQTIGSGIFFVCNGIIQYHLGATFNAYSRYSPTSMIFDFVRRWGRDAGLKWMHLGGGVEGAEDSVFQFKCGLSKSRREYLAARVIVDQQVYDQLCAGRKRLLDGRDDQAAADGFFPEYRAPIPLSEG